MTPLPLILAGFVLFLAMTVSPARPLTVMSPSRGLAHAFSPMLASWLAMAFAGLFGLSLIRIPAWSAGTLLIALLTAFGLITIPSLFRLPRPIWAGMLASFWLGTLY